MTWGCFKHKIWNHCIIMKFKKRWTKKNEDERSNSFSSNSESFKYARSILGKTPENYSLKVVIPLKYLSNFWKALNIPLINCEVGLILNWSKSCILADMTVNAGTDSAIVPPSAAAFKITDTNFYVPNVTLSKENNTKLLEQLKSGLKRTTKWNKYRSKPNKITTWIV